MEPNINTHPEVWENAERTLDAIRAVQHPWAAPDTPMPEPQRPTRAEMKEALRRIAAARGRKDVTLDQAADYALSVLDGMPKARDADNPLMTALEGSRTQEEGA